MVNVTELERMLSGEYKYHGTNILHRDESNIDDRESMVSLNPDDIALVCVTHIPTNSGIVNPVYAIGQLLNEYNQKAKSSRYGLPSIFYLVDACQSAGQTQLDVSAMKCHALTATGRKYLRAPRGTGFVFVKRDIANALVPSHIDHSSAPIIAVPSMFDGRSSIENIIDFQYKDGARRFEFWESNIANKLGLGEAIRFALEDIGINQIELKCTNLGNYLRNQLREMPHVTLHHDIHIAVDTTTTIKWQAEHRTSESHMCSIVTFSVDGMDPIDVKKKMESAREKRKQLALTVSAEEDSESLENHSFQLSVVPATSTPLDSAKMMVRDLLRASLSYFNTYAEIDLFCSKLASALKSP
jgi:selenocysteine lyase/cysteine desulfurase